MSVDQLVAASGNTQRLVNLASLSDSLDYLADAMQHFGDGHHTRNSALVCPFLCLQMTELCPGLNKLLSCHGSVSAELQQFCSETALAGCNLAL